MLTIKINNSNLEKRITEEARLVGKSTQEVIEDLLRNALPEKRDELIYQKLTPKAFGYILNANIDVELPLDETVSLFADVDNSAEYVKKLRKTSWRK